MNISVKYILNQVKPHAIAMGIFFAFVFFYCHPGFENKVILSTDGTQFTGMIQGTMTIDSAGNDVYHTWNRNLFSGMPFLFENPKLFNAVTYFFNTYFFNGLLKITLLDTMNWCAFYFWFACLSFYILTCILKLKNWIRIISSLAYAFGIQTSILIIAGHHTKLVSMGALPLIIAGFMLITQRKYFIGILLGTLGLKTIIFYEHYQMLFYALIVLFFITVSYLIHSFKIKEKLSHIIKVSTGTLLIILIAVLFHLPKLISYFEYSKETIRSGSKIVDKSLHHSQTPKTNQGVSKDYAFGWSYGIGETITFIAPDAYGGSSGGRLSRNANTVNKLSELGIPEDEAFNVANSFSTYWGEQPFTSGPIYFGVIICGLAILCFIYYRNWLVWGLSALTLFTIFIAWGKNFSTLNFFLFDHLPFYNKFRAPTMIFTMTQFSLAFLFAIGLQKIFIDKKEKIIFTPKFLKNVGIVLGSLVVLSLFFYLTADFKSDSDKFFLQQLTQMTQGNQQISNDIYTSLKSDRKELVQGNIVTIIVLSTIFFALIYFYTKNKLKINALLILIGVVLMFDYIKAGRIYINEEKFTDAPEKIEGDSKIFPKTDIDRQILNDTDQNYRVLDTRSNSIFTDASASYYHRSIGGYFAAKLSLYQDLIDSQLNKMNITVLSMLNTKYLIQKNNKNESFITINPDASGPCWFVKNVNFVPDTKTEMMSLNNFDYKQDAFILEDYKPLFTEKIKYDSSAKIINSITSHDVMEYKASVPTTQFAVFSEIFYPQMWQAFIDGKEVSTIKTNYVLRGVIVPQGQHTITFKSDLYTFKNIPI